jgi:hypothetical protein
MAKKNQRIYTILGTAVGAGLAVYGIRQGMRWYQRRQLLPHQFDTQFPESSWPTEGRYQPIDQPDHEPIPTTGPLTAAPTITEMPSVEQYPSTQSAQIDMDAFVAPLIEHAIAF